MPFKMKKLPIISATLICFLLNSCQMVDDEKESEPTKSISSLEANVKPEKLLKNFPNWWAYHTANISYTETFIALNQDSDTISKGQFLEALSSGEYIPIKMKSASRVNSYFLFPIDTEANVDIANTIKSEATRKLKHFRLEGQSLPDYQFQDLRGQVYTKSTTLGKILILKTWFTSCVACVAEFPELNDFVSKHADREDLLFLSLALNTKDELQEFLKTREFDYAVIPEQRDFIDAMELQVYPSHIIVNEKGLILKVCNKASEMISFFEFNLDQ